MIVIIDNYDSFTYNLYQYIGEINSDIAVFRNDQISVAELQKLPLDKIVISPGPGYPSSAGISIEVIKTLGSTIPILGVCLGHQAIAEAFGGRIIQANQLFHGKTSRIAHNGEGIFADVPTNMEVMRYHSLIVEKQTFPSELEIVATTQSGEIMALRHRMHPIVGLQFHPESIKTPDGKQLVKNFLTLFKERSKNPC